MLTKKFKSKSSDAVYTATVSADGDRQCSCRGFTFRKICKHVDELLKAMAESPKKKPVKTNHSKYRYLDVIEGTKQRIKKFLEEI